jgi:hypothetical protein
MLVCFAAVSSFSIIGCRDAVSTAENASPEALYSADPDIDLFVYEDTAYVNALDVDWAGELPLDKGEALGKVTRSGITDDFQDWDATVLPEGTVIYTSVESQVLLAETEEAVIPYLKYVEG